MLKLGIDVDGVLANSVKAIMPLVYHHTYEYYSEDNVNTWNYIFKDRFGTHYYDFQSFVDLYWSNDAFLMSIEPVKNALKYSQWLVSVFDVFIITDRGEEATEVTYNWLDYHNFYYNNIIFTTGKSKSDFGLDILIDDKLENIIEFNKSGLGILFAAPYNECDDTIKRLNGWDEVTQYLTKFT